MPQFIYTMKGLGKVHPPDTKVLEDIWLSFYFGAKIGVLGLNGAGKSSLLRIMAGRGHELPRRSVSRAEGISIGFLQQEPRLDPDEDRARQRRGGRRADQGAARALRRGQREARRGSVAGGDGQGPRRAVARSRTRSTRRTPGISIRASSWRWTRCGCRRRTPTSRRCRAASAAAWRSAACCCSRPTCCCSTSRPTISTPSRSPGSSAS